MARMYPMRRHLDPQSKAEQRLYNLFHDELPDSYVVFHSVNWLARDTKGGARDGEADFIIAHPDYGILVIEVKGGNIRYDGRTDQWYSYEHPINDPIAQARQSKHNLLAKLKELPYWQNRWFTIGHAVAFPDVIAPTDLKWDLPEIIVLDRREIDHLQSNIERIYEYWQRNSRQPGRIEEEGIEELIELLSPSWTLRPPFAEAFKREEKQVIRLAEEQFNLLDFLAERRRVAISGCAGSGKTMMAIEQARRLGKQDFKVLFTCYNYHLADHLRDTYQLPPSVEVLVYQELCERMAHRGELSDKLDTNRATPEWYKHTLPEILYQATQRLGPQYDAIIVDEAQNFTEDWWIPLHYLLNDYDQGIFYAFYDNNQNLYSRTFEIPEAFEHYPLNHNYRNTRQIHETFLRFYQAEKLPKAKGPRGRKPTVYCYERADELKAYVERLVRHLIEKEKLSPQDIAILSSSRKEKSLFYKWGTVAGHPLTTRWPSEGKHICCTNIYRFQGLEAPVVILAELASAPDFKLDTLFYVGCSRALNHLVILADRRLPESVLAQLEAVG